MSERNHRPQADPQTEVDLLHGSMHTFSGITVVGPLHQPRLARARRAVRRGPAPALGVLLVGIVVALAGLAFAVRVDVTIGAMFVLAGAATAGIALVLLVASAARWAIRALRRPRAGERAR